MRSAVIVFPGSNCDRDMAVALRDATGRAPAMVWHKETALPAGTDFVAIPGGFSFGDYLRCGAIAARSPVMRDVVRFADAGGMVLGVCNGWQVLLEAGLLPGALMRNRSLRFVCRDAILRVETARSPFTAAYAEGQILTVPVAHHDGAYTAGSETIHALESEARIAFRYAGADGGITPDANPNGSEAGIAGILSANRRILGMMPHPERAADATLGSSDGRGLFEALAGAMASA